MVDRERILARLDDLEQFLRELRQIAPATFAEYRQVEKRRSCERLLQIAIECVIDNMLTDLIYHQSARGLAAHA